MCRSQCCRCCCCGRNVLVHGMICCYGGWDCTPETCLCGTMGTVDACCCVRQSHCCAANAPCRTCCIECNCRSEGSSGDDDDPEDEECVACGIGCYEIGLIRPRCCRKWCAGAHQTCCWYDVWTFPCLSDHYVSEPVVALCCVQCYPYCGCCVEPPQHCPALDRVREYEYPRNGDGDRRSHHSYTPVPVVVVQPSQPPPPQQAVVMDRGGGDSNEVVTEYHAFGSHRGACSAASAPPEALDDGGGDCGTNHRRRPPPGNAQQQPPLLVGVPALLPSAPPEASRDKGQG